jgi:hypothetical protein
VKDSLWEGENPMKKASIIFISMIVSLILITQVFAQTPPQPDKTQPTAPTHTGNVVSLEGLTLTVTGGKSGQTAFNTATASWQGYASPGEVKAGDPVKVTYLGIVGGLKKAISVAKQGSATVGGLKKEGNSAKGK